MTLHKYLGPVTLLLLIIFGGGCRASLRAATEPITESIDKQTDKVIDKLKLEELSDKISKLVDSLNEIATIIKQPAKPISPWDWRKILPIALIICGALVAILILISIFKRKH